MTNFVLKMKNWSRAGAVDRPAADARREHAEPACDEAHAAPEERRRGADAAADGAAAGVRQGDVRGDGPGGVRLAVCYLLLAE